MRVGGWSEGRVEGKGGEGRGREGKGGRCSFGLSKQINGN